MKQQFTIKKKVPKILYDFLFYLQVIKNYSRNTIGGYKLDLMQFFNFLNEYHRFNIQIKDFNVFILFPAENFALIVVRPLFFPVT